jgi:hypothetical protein
MAKRLEHLREVAPTLRTLAIMADAGNPFSVLEVVEVRPPARSLCLGTTLSEIRRVDNRELHSSNN